MELADTTENIWGKEKVSPFLKSNQEFITSN